MSMLILVIATSVDLMRLSCNTTSEVFVDVLCVWVTVKSLCHSLVLVSVLIFDPTFHHFLIVTITGWQLRWRFLRRMPTKTWSGWTPRTRLSSTGKQTIPLTAIEWPVFWSVGFSRWVDRWPDTRWRHWTRLMVRGETCTSSLYWSRSKAFRRR